MNVTHPIGRSAIALEHMTGLSRGTASWLTAPVLDVVLDTGCVAHIVDVDDADPGQTVVARLNRIGDAYEIHSIGGARVWVNGQLVVSSHLKHGDTIEFGDTGPLCRLRVYTDMSPAKNSVADILSDIAAYLRVSRQRPVKRVLRAMGALFGRLAHETSTLFRITVLAALFIFAVMAYQQWQLNKLLQRDLERATAQLDDVATALVNAQKDALHPSDLTALRDSLERQMSSNVTRLAELEERSTATARVIAESNKSVAFLQGVYGFRDQTGDRMLRYSVNKDGVPLKSLMGRPFLTLDGDGPVVELEFTGTGFFVGGDDFLVTNRHVALPWEQSTGVDQLGFDGVEPVIIKFIAYLPHQAASVPVSVYAASDAADLAVMQVQGDIGPDLGLTLASGPPNSGAEVIVMGYPTGLRSMLAQSGPDFIAELQATGNTSFWSVAERLSQEGYIAPLASRGIVGQVTQSVIVYDAETTHGGSGGPVLDINGDVVGVNAAILPEYGGSNLGVPVSEVRALLIQAGIN